MSHLAHIVRLKEELSDLGVTCPFEQQNLTRQAYVRALIMHHFGGFGSFFVSEGANTKYWRALDMWNRVSPIKGQMIMSEFLTFVNGTRASLVNKGTSLEEKPSITLPDGTTKCLCSLTSFNDLAQWLKKELESGDE